MKLKDLIAQSTPGPLVAERGCILTKREIGVGRHIVAGTLRHVPDGEDDTEGLANAALLAHCRNKFEGLLDALSKALNERISMFDDPADDSLCLELSKVLADAQEVEVEGI